MYEDFGFKKVKEGTKKNRVFDVFSEVASHYDVMNDLMSVGIHRLWKNQFCSMVDGVNEETKILDVAGGTGDIAFRIKKAAKAKGYNPQIVICDINDEMLKICKDKAIDNNIIHNLDLVASDAEKLPFADNSFDYYTISFGIRNVSNIELALQEAYRVLKPGGKFLCMEFSKVENEYLNQAYNFYSFKMIPKIGELVASNKEAYQYLAESISLFPDQVSFKRMIIDAGFKFTDYKNLSGGIAAIHHGVK